MTWLSRILGIDGVVAGITSIFQARSERKQTAATARAKVLVKQADTAAQVELSTAEWENLALRQGETSWKDEAVSVVLLSPVVVLFVGAIWAGIQGGTPDSMLAAGERMIRILNSIEGEYAVLFSACVFAALGIRWKPGK